MRMVEKIQKKYKLKVKKLIQPAEKNAIDRNQFYTLRQLASPTFSELLSELNQLYELDTSDDKSRCSSHNGCRNCKTAAKELCMKYVLTIIVTEHRLREEFRKLKGAENTLAKYEEAVRLCDLDNSTRDTFQQKLNNKITIHPCYG